MRKEIDVFDYASEVMKAVKKGVLITTKVEDKVNLYDCFLGNSWN